MNRGKSIGKYFFEGYKLFKGDLVQGMLPYRIINDYVNTLKNQMPKASKVYSLFSYIDKFDPGGVAELIISFHSINLLSLRDNTN